MRPMHSVRTCVTPALANLLRRQPHSPAKLAFAWRAAVGEAIDRTTTVSLTSTGTLEVKTTNQHWRREIRRSTPIVLGRLRSMLGADRVTRITVRAPAEDRPRRRRRGEPKPPADRSAS